MKSILLIGLGRFGRHVAIKLNELNHQVMAIDQDEERVEAVLPYVTSAQIGDSKKQAFMESLGVSNFDVCIVAIGDDFQSSLETTSLLKELGAKLVVARAARDTHAKFLLRNGADEVVYPEKQLANWTAIRFSSDHILDYVEMSKENAIVEVSVPYDWVGQSVGELEVRRRYNINLLAVRMDGHLNINITTDTRFTGRETVLVLGSNRAIQKCFHT